MNPKRLVIGLTVLALGLGASIAYVQRPGSHPKATPGTPELSTDPKKALPQDAAPAPPAPATPPFSWRDVEAADYKDYIANLRAIGCPEQTIRDIILADVNKLYAAREEPLKTKPKSTPENPAAETPEAMLARLQQLRAVQQEKRWVVKELLGIDLPLDLLPSSGSRDYHSFEVAFKFLPAEKRDAVQLLQESYWQQSDALKTKYDKKRTPEFVAEYRQLSESFRQELAKVLTPQELDDYEMRTSADAKQLSTKLATYFRPSEDEFRKIFTAKRDYEQAIEKLSVPMASVPAATNPEDRKALAQQRAAERQAQEQARTTALNQMNEQLKSTLGEDRYAEYQRSQDRTYDLLARLGVRYNLPQEKVLEAYQIQQSYQVNTGNASGGTAPSPADRAEMQRRLNEQLTAVLGEQAVRGYRRVNGGTVPVK